MSTIIVTGSVRCGSSLTMRMLESCGISIIQDSLNKDNCNYLIITTAPNETIEQQITVFDCIQLQDFNVILLNGKNKKPNLTKKNIIICSKQFLQTKIDKESEEKNNSEEKINLEDIYEIPIKK